MRSSLVLCAAYLLSGSACAEVGEPPKSVAVDVINATELSTQVYEVLLRDCAFVECHGASGRFLRVVGPGRVRLSEMSGVFEPPTLDEMALTYDRVRAQINAVDPLLSDLLRKPLAQNAGGSGHRGLDAYGRDVYGSADHPSYQILQNFVMAQAQQMAAAVPTGQVPVTPTPGTGLGGQP